MVFENGSEQRFLDRGPLDTFVLQYKAVPRADRDALTAFFHTQKGSFDSTWTFDNRDPRLPDNGDFALGLKSWSTTQDATQSFVQSVGTGYTRAGEADAITLNKAITVAANSTVSCNFLSTAPFLYLYPGVLTLDLWASLLTNGGFSISLQPKMQFGVFTTDSSGAVLGTVALATQVTSLSGWHPVSANLPACPYPTANQGRVIVLLSITNPTNQPIYIPYNSVAMLFGAVRIYAPGQDLTYLSCAFEDDAIIWTENQDLPHQYDTSLRFRQVTTGGQFAPGSAGAAFPSFGPNNAFVGSYPLGTSGANTVVRNDLSTGNRIAYAFTGLPGFASRPLQRWTLPLDTLSDADVITLEQHFLGQAGSYRTFSFTDPYNGKPYSRVRYASDSLTVTHLQKGLHRAAVGLQEVFGPGWTA